MAESPAKICLRDTMKQIELLLEKRSQDFWNGETTAPGCTWDATMHGRSVSDAQPTIVLSPQSSIFRRNAKIIISDEDFLVHPRGVGLEYYRNGPEYFADDSQVNSAPDAPLIGSFDHLLPGNVRSSPKESHLPQNSPKTTGNYLSNGWSISVGSTICTLGGMVAINGSLFGLTVAHAFENEIEVYGTSPYPAIYRTGSDQIGSLRHKRLIETFSLKGQKDLDWALCSLAGSQPHTLNGVKLPDGYTLYSKRIVENDLFNAPVWVNTGTTGVVKGYLMGDYSLVALPGNKMFQRMWMVILERHICK